MGDVLLTQQACQRIAAALRCRQDERRTRQQRRRNLRDRGIEAQRGELQDARLGRDAEALDLGGGEIGNAAMGNDDPFRRSGGARGVDDVGGMLRVERHGGGGFRLAAMAAASASSAR